MEPLLKIEIRERGAGRDMILHGELDIATSSEVDRAVEGLCRDGITDVTIDLRELDFIDSSGLRAILRAHDVCGKNGTNLTLVRAETGAQERLFAISGLLGVLPFRKGPGEDGAAAVAQSPAD